MRTITATTTSTTMASTAMRGGGLAGSSGRGAGLPVRGSAPSSPRQPRSWQPRLIRRTTKQRALLERQNLYTESGACKFNIKYDPEQLIKRNVRSVGDLFSLAFRGTEISARLGLFFLELKADDMFGVSDVNGRSAELRELLTQLGPSFIKVGQLLANRPDIIRADYMEELCVLQDDVPAFADGEAFEIIERNLRRPISEVFSRISDRPVAAASLGQVYRGTLRGSGKEVAIKVQRPGVLPTIERDLVLFRWVAGFLNSYSRQQLGCDAQLIVDEFGEKLLEELDYIQEARNIEDFFRNFEGDPLVKIPWVDRSLSGEQVIVMEWIDGIRCTDPEAIRRALNADDFIRVGVVSALRQLLEFGLFHGDPHPGNIFALRDGRIAYVDFGNVAEISQKNKQVLIDAVVHAVNEDYEEMAGDFSRLGFLSEETDVTPIVPALEQIWTDSLGQRYFSFSLSLSLSFFLSLSLSLSLIHTHLTPHAFSL